MVATTDNWILKLEVLRLLSQYLHSYCVQVFSVLKHLLKSTCNLCHEIFFYSLGSCYQEDSEHRQQIKCFHINGFWLELVRSK